MKIVFALAIVVAGGLAQGASTQAPPHLKYAVVITRHGVRAPTWAPEQLNRYSAEPWPSFGVPPGHLTVHGRALMKTMGEYYRAHFTARGLLGGSNCGDAGRIYFWADTDQRTLETARALAEGILPSCRAEVHSLAEGTADPLFDPIDAGLVKPDGPLGVAAIIGRVGPQLDALIQSHRSAFDALARVLNGNGHAPVSIFDQPMTLTSNEKFVTLAGPLSTASTLTENLFLEYADGKSGNDLGWGRLNAETLQHVMSLHTAYADLMRRTPYLARARGSTLLNRILASFEQAEAGAPEAAAIGPSSSRLVIVSGHDTNISNLSGALDLTWTLPGYQQDDAPPGGALVFSLWQSSSGDSVRTQFVSQTPDQMHDGLAAPPTVADVFVPGCSTAGEGFPCPWPSFQRVLREAIDPRFARR